jgi:hypothetical protein
MGGGKGVSCPRSPVTVGDKNQVYIFWPSVCLWSESMQRVFYSTSLMATNEIVLSLVDIPSLSCFLNFYIFSFSVLLFHEHLLIVFICQTTFLRVNFK